MENYPVFRRAMLRFRVCTHVLLSRSPVALAGPLDLHAGIHVTSVHPELGSNSQINIIWVDYSNFRINYLWACRTIILLLQFVIARRRSHWLQPPRISKFSRKITAFRYEKLLCDRP